MSHYFHGKWLEFKMRHGLAARGRSGKPQPTTKLGKVLHKFMRKEDGKSDRT